MHGSIPGLGRSLGVVNENPFLYSCLEYSVDREVWWATVYWVAKGRTRLSMTTMPGNAQDHIRSSKELFKKKKQINSSVCF